MSIYYQDDSITLHHGDSLEILSTLDLTADVLLTDPPYFKVKQDEWDNQWDKAGEFLGWMGEWLDHAKPLLAPHASVWVFASPAMTSSVERLVGERFRVLNSIRWVKPSGYHMKRSLADMRRFMPAWEGIVFAEQLGREYELAAEHLRAETFKPVGDYFSSALGRVGVRAEDAAITLGFSSRLGRFWKTGARLPSEVAYEGLREITGSLDKPYEDVVREYRRLTESYESARESVAHKRRTFNPPTDRDLSRDVWAFNIVHPHKGRHPCEKPQDMLTHMIRVSSRPGQTILDPFAGSGSTLLAARNEGLRAVGIEKDEAWCEKIALRLSAETLPIQAA